MADEERYDEIKAKNFKFGGVGDYLKGTLLSVEKTTQADTYGKHSYIYKVKGKEGSFYGSTKNEKTGKFVMDTEPTIINEGEEYVFFVSTDKGVLIGAMRDVKVGQKFMIKFTELKPTTKGNDAKIVKVFAGKDANGAPLMDEQWVEANKPDASAQTAEQAAAFDEGNA